MKKIILLIVVSFIFLVPKETDAQTFEASYQQMFFKDTSWAPFNNQQMEFTGKYVLSYENCQEISLEVYMRSSTRPQGEGAPSEGIFSFDYMPNQNVGIKIGGGINFSAIGSHARIRGEVFLQNELYYIKLLGEDGGITGYYWNGQLILKVTPYFNVGFMADRSWLRTGAPGDGFGPRVELNVTGTPLTIFGGAIFPWRDCYGSNGGVEHETPGGYIGGSASF